jgi:hypothetical protein
MVEWPKHVAAARKNKTNIYRNCCGDGISDNPDYTRNKIQNPEVGKKKVILQVSSQCTKWTFLNSACISRHTLPTVVLQLISHA